MALKKYRNLQLFRKSVETSQECLQKFSEREITQDRRYSYIGLISVRKYANYRTDTHTWNLKLFGNSVQIPEMSTKNFRNISHQEQEISLYLSNFSKKLNKQTDRHKRNSELFGTMLPTSQKCLQKIPEIYLIQKPRYPFL